ARSDAGQRHGEGLGRIVRCRRRADARRSRTVRHADAAAASRPQVITPRRTRLVRVLDLHAFRHALRELAGIGDLGFGIRQKANTESRIPNPLVVVPTRAAARHAERLVGAEAELVARAELYDRLHA